jgi:hypothetical protein
MREHFGNDAWEETLEAALDPPEPPSIAEEECPASAQCHAANAATSPASETQSEFDGMAALREVFSEKELSDAGCLPAQPNSGPRNAALLNGAQ